MRENNKKGSSGKRHGGFRSGGNRFGGNRSGGRRFDSRGGFGRSNFSSGPREMHKATCADCKQECQVPFKPSGDRPVYCRDCFEKHKKF